MNKTTLPSLQNICKSLSPAEFLLAAVLACLFLVSTIGLLWQVQNSVSSERPVDGGELRIGIVGAPQYVNPVLATSRADRDVAALIFSGLMRLDESGQIEPDLATDYSVSEDGTRYTFTIRDDAEFSDGQPVTAEDVVFTVEMIQSQRVAAPGAADWSGVAVEEVNAETIRFILDEPFAGFIFNTTIGVLPAHYWQSVSPQVFAFASQNSDPVGSGPFALEKIERGDDSVADSLTLERRKESDGFIDKIEFRFFESQGNLAAALEDGEIDSAANISPEAAGDFAESSNFRVHTAPLNRIFAVFFNQDDNQNLAQAGVRQALTQVVDKQAVITEALSGYGTAISGPLPPERNTGSNPPTSGSTTNGPATDEVTAAQETLAELGWEKNDAGELTNSAGEVFELTLTTADIPALARSAEVVAQAWRELGLAVTLDARSSAELSGEVIRPREYEALLFGQSVNRSGDLYPFWHSSAASDPGLNLAMYRNNDIDTRLSELRETRNERERATMKDEIATTISDEQPALFLYSPDFIHVTNARVRGVTLPTITAAEERFAGLEDWYTDTRRLWNLFTENGDDDDSANSETDTTTDEVNTDES